MLIKKLIDSKFNTLTFLEIYTTSKYEISIVTHTNVYGEHKNIRFDEVKLELHVKKKSFH